MLHVLECALGFRSRLRYGPAIAVGARDYTARVRCWVVGARHLREELDKELIEPCAASPARGVRIDDVHRIRGRGVDRHRGARERTG